MSTYPEWLKTAPKWFQAFYGNDFVHLQGQVVQNKQLLFLVLAAVVGFAFTICLKVF